MKPSIQEIIDLLAENKDRLANADDEYIRQIHRSVQEALLDAELAEEFFPPAVTDLEDDDLERLLGSSRAEEPEDDLLERLLPSQPPEDDEDLLEKVLREK